MNQDKSISLKVAGEWTVAIFIYIIILSITSCNIADKFASALCLQYDNIYTNKCEEKVVK